MNWHRFLGEWKEAAEAQGFAVELLLERGGYPIFACSKGSAALPTVYLSSGVHGDEPAGPQALLSLLRAGFFDERFRWLICPILNPTGLEAGTRETVDGVDMNRDYRTCESPEACTHISWLEKQEAPKLFLSLHEDWESTGFYYYEINTGAEAPAYEEILAAVAPFFPPEPEEEIDEHPVTKPGWIFHPDSPDIPEGWPEAIYLSRKGCPLSLTFETPSSKVLEDRIGCHEAAVRCAIEKLAQL
ncbi:M14 family metallocarboxypeptidase [bacterium]|nr:M14 family metallocarboxypeptidase [Akkermansiaceae bacterium]MDB4296140.1 M14 family metallocarboxypeptidase [bacterium]MDA7935210.1 M14 family metallocarboxypeptidase [Akkermansiaceae bacterium]MDB4356435.1 M14 family metallocarboxypeptidase [Akkermansiaceae bacterium]MDB4374021.1 M14 family metallocarboxypeptidase [Akkermansiaceae bacterium]